MKRRRTAIFISGRGSNMEALLRAAQNADYPAEIVTVISNRPDAKGLETALSYSVKAVGLDHKDYANREAFELELNRHCGELEVELIACAGFMRILTDDFIHRWRGRMINIHPSLLPSYRGLKTHERALSDGVKIHGCTVHFVTNDLDAGPIIAQAAVPVLPKDTAEGLARRVLAQEHRLYPLVLEWLSAGLISLSDGKVTHSFDVQQDYGPFLVPSATRRAF
jgi:phosphoribosylglycinamide formyltransferase-1